MTVTEDATLSRDVRPVECVLRQSGQAKAA